MQKDEITQLQKEMISKLKSLSDNGQRVVKNVYTSREIFSGKELERAPDLVVGFEKGYRMSWQSAVGGAPGREVIENNMNKWSGDHCFDAEYVPGILLTSNKSILKNPSVLDIAPAILDFTDTR